MRSATILFREEEAGLLIQHDDGHFTFRYLPAWLDNSVMPPISPTFPKIRQEFRSAHLFPFFFHMLPEGTARQFICSRSAIDRDDDFGLLMTTAKGDNIGAIRVIANP